MRDTDTAFAVVLRSAGRVVAIVPAIIRRERVVGPLDLATLYPLSELTPAHSDVLRELTGRTSFRHSSKRSLRCRAVGTSCESGDCSSPVRLRGSLRSISRNQIWRHRIRREQPSFMLELGPSYEQFLAARSAKFRNHLRRKTRQLDAAGQVKVLRAGRDLGVEEAYEHLLSIEERSWKHAHGTAISAVPHQREFYRLLCEGAAGRGRLHLMLMYLDDVPIAFNLGITVCRPLLLPEDQF